MKKLSFFIIFILLSFNSFAQIIYEKGYFILNSGDRVSALIENLDWKYNPTKFKYKLEQESESGFQSIETIREFGIDNKAKFVKASIDLDHSSDNINNMSHTRNPEYIPKEVFLKVLIEGEANLYEYKDTEVSRYFYTKKGSSSVIPLIHKRYINSGKIHINNHFRQQLLNDLPCQGSKSNPIYTKYTKKELLNYFINYNKCVDVVYTNFVNQEKRDVFNLSFQTGVNSSSLEVSRPANLLPSFNNNTYTAEFKDELGLRFGIELEFILPYNKNKWSIIIDPAYRSYKSSSTFNKDPVTVNYKSIEFPLGVRHSFFLNKNSKLFLNASAVFDFTIDDSKMEFELYEDKEITTNSFTHIALGGGLKFSNKYSLAIKMDLDHTILGNYASWSSHYKSYSLIFGYNLF